jgi:hypothetical protein
MFRYEVKDRVIDYGAIDLEKKIQFIKEYKQKADTFYRQKQLRSAAENYIKIEKLIGLISKKEKKKRSKSEQIIMINSMRNYAKVLNKEGNIEKAITTLNSVNKIPAFVSKVFYEKLTYLFKNNDPIIFEKNYKEFIRKLKEKVNKNKLDDMEHEVAKEIYLIEKEFKKHIKIEESEVNNKKKEISKHLVKKFDDSLNPEELWRNKALHEWNKQKSIKL